jgi:hypothetical protein
LNNITLEVLLLLNPTMRMLSPPLIDLSFSLWASECGNGDLSRTLKTFTKILYELASHSLPFCFCQVFLSNLNHLSRKVCVTLSALKTFTMLALLALRILRRFMVTCPKVQLSEGSLVRHSGSNPSRSTTRSTRRKSGDLSKTFVHLGRGRLIS